METTNSNKTKAAPSVQNDRSSAVSSISGKQEKSGIIADNDSGTQGANQDSSNKGKGPAGENL